MADNSSAQLTCSFCHKSQTAVKKLVAGYDAYICNECVAMCWEIMEEEGVFEEQRRAVEYEPIRILSQWVDKEAQAAADDPKRLAGMKRHLEMLLLRLNQ